MANAAWIIPLCPLAAFLLIAFGARASRPLSAGLSILGTSIAFGLSLAVLGEAMRGIRVDVSVPWIPIPAIPGGVPPAQLQQFTSPLGPGVPGQLSAFPVGFQVDPLTAVMLLVVTSVSLLVQIYSLGYMRGDDGFSRYYAHLSLFTMSMLGLVLANNLLAIYIFWELVGLCSYLLIGHWHERPEAAEAAKKAFIVTRVGDVGFLLGILFLYWHTGTFVFTELIALAAGGRIPEGALTVAILLIFCGAVGKSAQFPLHVWLPDAMEGPTPVSALIHAATMVAAGVYLMARAFPLLEHSPFALAVVATIGAFTAIFAATMGLVATDIKRVLAYSTVSQLGYMMLAIGVGAMGAGIFHLFNHAFFKALLFLCAGSVIHAVGTNEMFQMGGLRRRLPITATTMAVGAVSLAGLPPFSGFWSKDEILGAALARQPVLFALALITVGLTAFYMFRVLFLTFDGESRAARGDGGQWRADSGNVHPPTHAPLSTHHAGEEPSMAVPLIVLAVPSIVSGFWGMPFIGNPFAHFLEGPAAHPAAFNPLVAGASAVVALAGIGVAWSMYGGGKTEPGARLSAQLAPLHGLLVRRYYMDDLYNAFASRIVMGVAQLARYVDTFAIDAMVNGTGALAIVVGSSLRRLQSGQVQMYAWVLFAGVVTLALVLVGLRIAG